MSAQMSAQSSTQSSDSRPLASAEHVPNAVNISNDIRLLALGLAPNARRRRRLPLLNADRLTSSKGIHLLPRLFSRMKFAGKGHEREDLNQVMSTLEHWSHRMYPTITFDDLLEKVEKLGSKRVVKTFVNKIRFDLPLFLDENEIVVNEDKDCDNDDDNANNEDNADIFDRLVSNSDKQTKQTLPNND